MKQYTAIVAGARLDVMLTPAAHQVQVAIGGRRYTLDTAVVQPGTFLWNWNHRSIEVIVTEGSDGYIVSIGGHRIPVQIVDPRKPLRQASHHGHDGAVEVRAPMPGKIVRVLVEEQAEVEANQGLLVMEAMKMQNEIKSPKKGKVIKLAVVEGAAVNSGDLIVTVE